MERLLKSESEMRQLKCFPFFTESKEMVATPSRWMLMVLNLKYAKPVKACQAEYWHLRIHYFTPLTWKRILFGYFSQKNMTSRSIVAIVGDILYFPPTPFCLKYFSSRSIYLYLFLWHFLNTGTRLVTQICQRNILYIEFLNSPLFCPLLKNIEAHGTWRDMGEFCKMRKTLQASTLPLTHDPIIVHIIIS